MRFTIIILASALTFLSIFMMVKINKTTKEKSSYITRLNSLEEENKNLSNLLVKYRKCYPIKSLELNVSGPEKVIIGDTINLNLFFQVTDVDRDLFFLKPAIELAEELDTTILKLKNVYKTIPLDNWEGNIKIKAEKLGIQKVQGLFYLPFDSMALHAFPIYKEFEVVNGK